MQVPYHAHIVCIAVRSSLAAKVWQMKFWMMHFGTPSEKPTMVMGDLFTMYFLNKGTLTKAIKKKHKKLTTTRTFDWKLWVLLGWNTLGTPFWNPPLVGFGYWFHPKRFLFFSFVFTHFASWADSMFGSILGKYTDSAGRPRFAGKRKELKSTQPLHAFKVNVNPSSHEWWQPMDWTSFEVCGWGYIFRGWQEISWRILGDLNSWLSSFKTPVHGLVYLSLSLYRPRSYTTEFGTALHEAFQKQLLSPPARDLRRKVLIDGGLSDRELFAQMATGDVWDDAKMPEVFEYIWQNHHCRTSWLGVTLHRGLWFAI